MFKRIGLTAFIGLFVGLGCGDEDEGDAGDTMGGDNPVASAFACSGSETPGTCDQLACQIARSYDQARAICSGSGAPSYCEAIIPCIGTYGSCMEQACPSGTNLQSLSNADYQNCASNYFSCFQGAGGSTPTGNNPIADVYACGATNPVTSCDAQACAVSALYEQVSASCASIGSSSSCSGFVSCIGTYSSCIQGACPAGEDIGSRSAQVTACATSYTSCIQNSSGG